MNSRIVLLPVVAVILASCGAKNSDGIKNQDISQMGKKNVKMSLYLSEKNKENKYSRSAKTDYTSASLKLKCAKVFGDDSWTSTVNVAAASNTFQIIQGKNCSVELLGYVDANGSYAPAASSVVVNLDASGNSEGATAEQAYNIQNTTAPNAYYFAGIGKDFGVVFNFSTDAGQAPEVTRNDIPVQTAKAEFNGVATPNITSIISEVANANGASYYFNFVGTNYNSCKLIVQDDTHVFPTNRDEVAAQYKDAAAVDCEPVRGQGNWNKYASSNVTVIWANTVDGATAYTYGQIPLFQ